MDVFSDSAILSDPQFKALGQIAALSAWSESVVDHFIAALCRLSKLKAEIIMDRKMLDAKFEALRLLARAALKTEAEKNKFSDMIRKAKDANTERNTMLHGIWHAGAPAKNKLAIALMGPKAIVYKTTSPGHFKTRTAWELEATARAIYRTTWTLIVFLEVDMMLRPLPRPRVRKLHAPEYIPPRKAATSR